MCGRFTQAYTWQELVALYRLSVPAINLEPRYNIAPTTTIDMIIPRGADRLELTPMRWSLIPIGGKRPPGSALDLQCLCRDGDGQADIP